MILISTFANSLYIHGTTTAKTLPEVERFVHKRNKATGERKTIELNFKALYTRKNEKRKNEKKEKEKKAKL